MPVHDWTRVEAGVFHDFHTVWTVEVRNALNAGLLPEGYYAMAEQHAGRFVADVLTLHGSPASSALPPLETSSAGTALAEAPPRVRRKQTIEPAALSRRRSLAIRHVSGHRLIALIEILSPANKDRREHVEEFAVKAAAALDQGVHLLLVDLFPPTSHDPCGMHDVIRQHLAQDVEAYDLPGDEPLTLASYAAGERIEAYLNHLAVGTALSDMPLFLTPERYIDVPLESTYMTSYRVVPEVWREVLD